MVVLGFALDRLVEQRVEAGGTAYADGPGGGPGDGERAATKTAPVALVVDAAFARSAVRAAWRTSGIEVNDDRIDDIIARSRLSALLPETRLRAVRTLTDSDHATSYVNEAGTLVSTVGSTLALEGRLTWHLDRLLFADDEPTLERIRMERQDARARIGTRVLELLFGWQRALLDLASSDAGSRAEVDAALRKLEAELALDVLTGGWFKGQPVAKR
jgi:hypothetical protein